MSLVTEMYDDGFEEGYNQALEDVKEALTHCEGIDSNVLKCIEELKK